MEAFSSNSNRLSGDTNQPVDFMFDTQNFMTEENITLETLAHVSQITLAHSRQEHLTLHVHADAYAANREIYIAAMNASPFIKVVIEP